ncbi:MAG TPA: RsmE family RNA methyltransferase [Candidatus Eisenbacteria bacterium]|nr:RsmE family RNA methyltransferase [Candidatus Eisenbacteria bacterium]
MSAARTGAPCCIVVDDLSGTHVAIVGPEADHVRKALRVRPGEHVAATDGRGARATLEITGFHKHVVEARVVAKRQEPLPARRLWLATAAAGPRFDWLVEKSVELGAFGLLVLAPEAGMRPRTERWERVARAALGQSLGSWRLKLGAVPGARAAVEDGEPDGAGWASIQVADPDGGAGDATVAASGAHLLLAGPPDGFAAPDRAYLLALPGVGRIRLGDRRLRSETAGVALLVWATVQTGAFRNS